jgi:hypothetical protein
MNKTQLVILEISETCNRGSEHKLCPNAHPERWKHTAHRKPVPDELLVDIAVKAYAMGFVGMVAFHHYCEPLMEWPRLRRVIMAIRERAPQSRFLLWTNGDLFPDDLSEFTGLFSMLCVTNYAGRDMARLSAVCKNIHLISTKLDWRLNPPPHYGREPHCIRPYLEIIIDYFGSVRTCCMDWRGETSIGNVHDTPFDDLWKLWLERRDKLASTPMVEDAPQRCLSCGTRYIHLADYVPEVASVTRKHLGLE